MIDDTLTKSRSDDVESMPSGKKRKLNTTPTRMNKAARVSHDDDNEGLGSLPVKKTRTPRKTKDEEKRLRVFRKRPSLSYHEKLSRATSQR